MRLLHLKAACLIACAVSGCKSEATELTSNASAATAASAPAAASASARPDALPHASFVHLLVAYKGAMRAPDTITRTKEEARVKARDLLREAHTGVDFDKLVMEHSDDQMKGTFRGKTGPITPENRFTDFVTKGFALKPGGIAYRLAETPYGFHVIKRLD